MQYFNICYMSKHKLITCLCYIYTCWLWFVDYIINMVRALRSKQAIDDNCDIVIKKKMNQSTTTNLI